MDFNILNEYFVMVVMVACLVVGYIIKHATFFKWVNNKDIPIILGVIGAIVNVFSNGLSVDSIVYGALTGLASTGLHQAFKKFIENQPE